MFVDPNISCSRGKWYSFTRTVRENEKEGTGTWTHIHRENQGFDSVNMLVHICTFADVYDTTEEMNWEKQTIKIWSKWV